MKYLLHIKKIILSIDIIIFLLCLGGIYHISQKADVPFLIEEKGSDLIIKSPIQSSKELSIGDKIISIDGFKFLSREQIEMYLDGKNINESVLLTVERNNIQREINVELIKYYSVFYLITAITVGVIFFIIAIFVLYKATDKKPAFLFHNVVISTATIIMTTWGNYMIEPYGLGFLIRIVFNFAYAFTPTLYLHFTMIFPSDRTNRKYLIPLYIFSFLIGIELTIAFILAVIKDQVLYFHFYEQSFNLMRLFAVIIIISAIIVFIYSYKKLSSVPERKKFKWVLFGFFIGPIAFVFLWVIPQALTSYGLIPEEFILIMMTSIPITFGIAIVKYHLYDIDFIINRSIVYVIVVSILVIIYLLVVITATYFISAGKTILVSITAAVIITLVFQNIKNRIQGFVDKKFFKVHYNFREAVKELFIQIQSSISIIEVAEKVINEINKLIPLEMIAFFTFDSKSEKLNLQVKYNFDEVAVYNIIPDQITLREIKRGAVAVRGCVEPGLNIRIIEVESLSKGNIGLMFPILSSGELSAILILGRKKSGQRFFAEDLDLLNQIINETGTAIEKILLRENVNNERLKKEKLEEVNQLKSLFVSNVSHEFKTPLTSIKIFSELLEGSGDITSSKHLDYLKVINGESDRLSRMIENVLDIVKIERGIKEYHFTEVNLNDLVTEALKIMEYQLKIQKFTVYTQFVEFQENIFADRDAIIECILNLLSNSIKYSREIKEIIISTFSQDSRQVVCIEDKGIGIRQEDINKIFEAYFRAKDEETQRIPGTGLGLAIIKHVMDAHNGNIEIKSEVQKGTCFKLIFQVGKSNEKYINH